MKEIVRVPIPIARHNFYLFDERLKVSNAVKLSAFEIDVLGTVLMLYSTSRDSKKDFDFKELHVSAYHIFRMIGYSQPNKNEYLKLRDALTMLSRVHIQYNDKVRFISGSLISFTWDKENQGIKFTMSDFIADLFWNFFCRVDYGKLLGLSGNEKLVYLHLSSHCPIKGNICYLKVNTLIDALRLQNTSKNKSITLKTAKKLENAGIINWCRKIKGKDLLMFQL